MITSYADELPLILESVQIVEICHLSSAHRNTKNLGSELESFEFSGQEFNWG
jgi:hypothetical protein